MFDTIGACALAPGHQHKIVLHSDTGVSKYPSAYVQGHNHIPKFWYEYSEKEMSSHLVTDKNHLPKRVNIALVLWVALAIQ